MEKSNKRGNVRRSALLMLFLLLSHALFAQDSNASNSDKSLLAQPGVIIVFVLVLIVLAAVFFIIIIKANMFLIQFRENHKLRKARILADYIKAVDVSDQEEALFIRKKALDYKLHQNELSGTIAPGDNMGLVNNISHKHSLQLFPNKKDPVKRPKIDPGLSKLVLWFMGSAIVWLVIATSIGEYVGIKFVAPDADHISWLTFGRLRAVHTNLVFWAWATIGILGLGHYVISITNNAQIYSLKLGWLALKLVNVSMFVGAISLMAGINNGGGEYKEMVWPIMLVWATGLALTLYNFIKTIAARTTKEIYISNWFIVSALIFILIIGIVGYLPFGQSGVGETILQGYYMHQAVGMWFMFSTLGFLYYFIPQQLNKPIYSYSLGVLAFWTNIFFYTMIGTHHFEFSALPWWLQTTAIVCSGGMLIPVAASVINFLMTFRGDFKKVGTSYTLPFYLVGVVFYFIGSYQGTAEAFRYSNLIWHFTDFTVAHSHLTMYGIISFVLFASIYAVVPRLTGKEPSKLIVGAHFWFAFIGLLFYTIPLMIGGTLKGKMWMDQKPFIDSVVMMAPYWLWRAIGGSMMWLSHIFFAYNFYKMTFGVDVIDVKEQAFAIARSDIDSKIIN